MAGDVIIYRLYLALFHDGVVCTVELGELGHWGELGPNSHHYFCDTKETSFRREMKN